MVDGVGITVKDDRSGVGGWGDHKGISPKTTQRGLRGVGKGRNCSQEERILKVSPSLSP